MFTTGSSVQTLTHPVSLVCKLVVLPLDCIVSQYQLDVPFVNKLHAHDSVSLQSTLTCAFKPG